MKNTLLLVALCLVSFYSTSQSIGDFEDLNLSANSFWNGISEPLGTRFSSGDYSFYNYFDTSFGGFWSAGWAYSNVFDTTTAGSSNLYASVTGAGSSGSSNYCVGQQGSILALDSSIQGSVVPGIYITNGTFAYISMRDGDSFAKKFGGVTGNDPDFFKLVIQKYLNGNLAADSVEFYLADFRFSDNSQDYILKSWTWVDLSSLGNADSLIFTLRSSDVGSFGINTPTFFCVDEVGAAVSGIGNPAHQEMDIKIFPTVFSNKLTIELNDSNNEEYEFSLFDQTGRSIMDSKRLSGTRNQIIIDGLDSGIYFARVSGHSSSKTFKVIKE